MKYIKHYKIFEDLSFLDDDINFLKDIFTGIKDDTDYTVNVYKGSSKKIDLEKIDYTSSKAISLIDNAHSIKIVIEKPEGEFFDTKTKVHKELIDLIKSSIEYMKDYNYKICISQESGPGEPDNFYMFPIEEITSTFDLSSNEFLIIFFFHKDFNI